MREESEDAMERLISLFREADYEQWSPSQAQPPPLLPSENEEPLYFQQLLAFLREQKQEEREGEDEEADDEALIGV
jgi:hypothetical protein